MPTPDSGLPAADLETSRRSILAAIAGSEDVTFVRGLGNIGDELIWAGTRALLSEHPYREITLDDLPTACGGVAVISGGGGWSRTFHDLTPVALAVAEERFARVVVLPSSFEVDVPEVRAALEGTQAIVFAREPVSYRAIQPLCDARLALDCAFFADVSRYRRAAGGAKVLNAFRTDPEKHAGADVPPDNDDISLTARDLDDFLRRIAAAAHVRTDRAHVMIAAALLGRSVEYGVSNYHKVPAIAEWALAGYPVTALPRPPAPAGRRHVAPRNSDFILRRADGAIVDDATLTALERTLGARPEADAAVATIVGPDDRVLHAGGRLEVRDGVAFATASTDGGGLARRVDWAPPGVELWRRRALRHAETDEIYGRFAPQARGLRGRTTILHAPDAVARFERPASPPPPNAFGDRAQRLRAVDEIRRVHADHGVVLADLFDYIPFMEYEGRYDLASARLLFALLEGKGLAWVLSAWHSGDIAPLFRGPL